jgi:hypothetical protein
VSPIATDKEPELAQIPQITPNPPKPSKVEVKKTKEEMDNFKFHTSHSEIKKDELGDTGIAYKFED